MSKYIDVNDISNRLRSRLGYFGLYHPEDTKNIEELQTCLELVNGTPAAEVKPIVYGEWIDINGIKSCNQCGAGNASAYDSFCPNCGAVMRKEEQKSEKALNGIAKGFEDFTKMMFEQGQAEREEK